MVQVRPALANDVVSILQSIDWLTMTCKRLGSRNAIARLAHDYAQDSMEVGHTHGEWHQFGYDGWYCNSMRWGRRDQDDLLSLSGQTASALWDKYLPYADNCSRVDLAVTIKFRTSRTDVLPAVWETVKDVPSPVFSRMESTNNGYTIYVGSRSSSQFGRLYNKHAEGGPDWENCLRWEVEYKRPLAWMIAGELLSSRLDENYIYSRVATWFTERGVEIPLMGIGEVERLFCPRNLLPDEKRLEWLKRQVSPTVVKLVNKGLRERVCEVLGLLPDE